MPLFFRGLRRTPFRGCARSYSTSGSNTPPDLTHVDESGAINMVDVSSKAPTQREATARCAIFLTRYAHDLVRTNGLKKGDVVSVAKVAGIMAAKRTWDTIPLCHPIADMGKVDIQIELDPADQMERLDKRLPIGITATVRCKGPTGVEMEALHACSIAALTVYDMCKAVDKGMIIEGLKVVEKRGGKSGDWKTS